MQLQHGTCRHVYMSYTCVEQMCHVCHTRINSITHTVQLLAIIIVWQKMAKEKLNTVCLSCITVIPCYGHGTPETHNYIPRCGFTHEMHARSPMSITWYSHAQSRVYVLQMRWRLYKEGLWWCFPKFWELETCNPSFHQDPNEIEPWCMIQEVHTHGRQTA